MKIPAGFELVPGTDIEEIRAAHPDWTEEQCRDEQSAATIRGFARLTMPRAKKKRVI